jgi:hypothetical protein
MCKLSRGATEKSELICWNPCLIISLFTLVYCSKWVLFAGVLIKVEMHVIVLFI